MHWGFFCCFFLINCLHVKKCGSQFEDIVVLISVLAVISAWTSSIPYTLQLTIPWMTGLLYLAIGKQTFVFLKSDHLDTVS